MGLLLVSNNFPPRTGGSSRWFWEIYRRLPRSRTVIAAGEDPAQEEFDQTHDLRVVRMPLALPSWGVLDPRGLYGYCRGIWRLRRLVKAERVEAVHCGCILPEGLMALALKYWCKLPYVCYVHGEEMNLVATSRELTFLARQVLRHAEFIVANSRNTERILTGTWNMSPERVNLLHPGVDTKRFVPAARDRSVRQQLGWGDRTVVLTVGRLQKRKGHDQMIRAVGTIRKAIPNVLYAIVGDGEERPILEDLVQRENLGKQVQFLGETGDEGLVHCYQQCDLFVLPNRQVGVDIEGFGMVLLEAQACGKPVVAGASGGTAETMRIPETGQVVPCDTPDQLAALVTELLLDPDRLQRMGEAGRRWVVEQFDWSSLTRQAERLFHRERPRLEPVPARELTHT